ncbi:MAG: porin [Thiobacillus sp.]
MMKKILAVAIVSAFAAPAFAATANVDIYGTFAPSVDYVDGGSGTAGDGITSKDSESRSRVSANVSFIGFKGAEDLGGGLSAIWQFESQIGFNDFAENSPGQSAAQAGGLFGARESFAGLSSKNLGSVTFGLRDTALKVATGKLDVYGGGHTLADYRTLIGAVSNGSIRANNSVTYISPSFGGLTFRGTTAAMQEEGSSRNPHLYSLSGTYENGPLFVTLAHEDMKFARATGAMFGAGGYVINAVTGAGAETEQKNTRLGAGYSFGSFKLGAVWERTKVDVNAIGASTLNVTRFNSTPAPTVVEAGLASASTDRDAWYLSGAFAMGNTTLKAAYGRAGELDGINDSGAQQISAGVDYSLSKRTTVYGLFTQVRNDSNAAYSLGGAPTNTATFQSGGGVGAHGVAAAAMGQDPRGISVGMIHKF